MKKQTQPSDRKVKRIEKKIAKLQSKLNGEPRETKAERKARRAAGRAQWLQKLRSRRPFDLKCVKWYEKRQLDIANGKTNDEGVIGGDVATA
jgi:hypothetical protein